MPLAQFVRPKTLLEAYNYAKLHEISFNALYQQIDKQLSHKAPSRIIQPPYKSNASHSPHKNPTVVNTRNPNQKNMSWEIIREKNLYYKCLDKYHLGHQCKNKALNTMEAEEFVDAHEEVLEPEKIEVEDTDQAEVTLNVILGRSKTPSTIKIKCWVKGHQVVVLIDCGSINCFINPQLAKASSIFMEELGRPMRVKVANRQYVVQTKVS